MQPGGLEFGDTEDVLEVFVKDVEETVGKAPEEEESCNEDETCQAITLGHGCADN